MGERHPRWPPQAAQGFGNQATKASCGAPPRSRETRVGKQGCLTAFPTQNEHAGVASDQGFASIPPHPSSRSWCARDLQRREGRGGRADLNTIPSQNLIAVNDNRASLLGHRRAWASGSATAAQPSQVPGATPTAHAPMVTGEAARREVPARSKRRVLLDSCPKSCRLSSRLAVEGKKARCAGARLPASKLPISSSRARGCFQGPLHPATTLLHDEDRINCFTWSINRI